MLAFYPKSVFRAFGRCFDLFAAKAGLVGIAALALAPTAVLAQSGEFDLPPPSTFNTVDANSIDLASGMPSFRSPTLSIGPAEGGLTFSRYSDSGEWRDDAGGRVDRVQGTGETNDGFVIYRVTVMGKTIVFKDVEVNGQFTLLPAEGSGAVLTRNDYGFVLTDEDGSVAVFDDVYRGTRQYSTWQPPAVLSRVTRPNGEVINFYYREFNIGSQVPYWRLQSYSNNRGYQVNIQYASDGYVSGLTYPWKRIVKVTAFNATVDQCDYQSNNCTFSRTWPSLTFASVNNEFQITDALNNTTRYRTSTFQPTYGAAFPAVTGVAYPGTTSGYDVAFEWNGDGCNYGQHMISKVTTATGSWNYSYVCGWSDPLSYVSKATVVDPLGRSSVANFYATATYEYQVSHLTTRVVSTVNSAGKTTSYEYYPNFRTKAVYAPEGNGKYYEYDDRDNITAIYDVNKSGVKTLQLSAVYPSSCDNAKTCNKPTSVSDALGRTKHFTYDGVHGGVLTEKAPAPSSAPGAIRPEVRTSYSLLYAWYKNTSGVIAQDGGGIYLPTEISQCVTGDACAGTADELKTTIVYGAAGVANNLRPTSETVGGDGVFATNVTSYDALGGVASVDGPLSGSSDLSMTRYDAVGRVTGLIEPAITTELGQVRHRATRTTYDSRDRPVSVESGTVNGLSDADWAAFSVQETLFVDYDASGRKAKERYEVAGALLKMKQYSYDAADRLVCEASRMNLSVAAPVSACTRGTDGADGADRITYTEYDNAGRVTKVTKGYGTPDVAVETEVTYTDNGLVRTLTDGNGNVTTSTYDSLDRLVKTAYPNATTAGQSSTTDVETFGYDAVGMITSITVRNDPTIRTITYDNLGRKTLGLKGDTYAYDNLSRVTSATVGGQSISYVYDGLGRIKSETTALGTMTYEYDAAGRRTRAKWPGADNFFVDYIWDNADGLKEIRERGATSGVGLLATFHYDEFGRRSRLVRGNGATTLYSYDSASRMNALNIDMDGAGTTRDLQIGLSYTTANQIRSRTLSNAAYAWPSSIQSRTYDINGLNQVTRAGDQTLTYDSRGNLQSDGVTSYGYDIANNLTSASNGVSLSYGPTGMLSRLQAGTTVTSFLYDGSDLVAEYDGGGTLLRRYVHGLDDDEPLVSYDYVSGSGVRSWLVADQLGSIVALADDTGAWRATNTYNEYGLPGAGNTGRFQYTGQIWLPELGLYYYKRRMYSPTLGRFLQPDPIGYTDGPNLYAYVHNDPVNGIDPTGLLDAEDDTVDEIVVTARRPFGHIGRFDVLGAVASIAPFGDAGLCVLRGCSRAQWRDAAITGALDVLCSKACSIAFKVAKFGGRAGAKAIVRNCLCLGAGTMVATPDGLKPIEAIAIGDQVMAYDLESGRFAPQPVIGLVRPAPQPTMTLMLKAQSGEAERFNASIDHPWLVAGKGWVSTGDLKVGDVVRTAGAKTLLVDALVATGKVEQTYNLTVANWHTFAIGQDGAVVHNAGVCDLVAKLPRLQAAKPAYHVNPAHVKGTSDYNPRKTPLPDDAQEVYAKAVPGDPEKTRAWFGMNSEGKVYRFFDSNDGKAHFSGIDGVGPGIEIPPYAKKRLKGL